MTVPIGGELVNRLGYGAMQLTGPGVWGEPADPGEAASLTDEEFAAVAP
jgi:hypothetical protein